MTRALALDVGGTKLAAAWVDDSGAVTGRREVPTDPTGANRGDELWQTVRTLLDDVVGGQSPTAVGVGCGGPMLWPAGVVSPINLPAWRDFPLRARLLERFPDATVRIHNDAVAMLAGEHWQGAARGTDAALGVVVSTGVGGGVLLGGRIVNGASGNAGHLGHLVVEPDGPVCGCGARGCLEAVARGPAVVGWAKQHGWSPPAGATADGKALAESARAGDQVARAAFARAGDALGIALAGATSLLELEVAVIGGGLAGAGDLLLGPARESFRRHARLDFARRCGIVPAENGAEAGLIGAAALVLAGKTYWEHGAD
ncbi:MAG TPA: ROK family protein [Mycobacteriales bacterium]|nr:ROK family protein [Mycobacteriales bacterium]